MSRCLLPLALCLAGCVPQEDTAAPPVPKATPAATPAVARDVKPSILVAGPGPGTVANYRVANGSELRYISLTNPATDLPAWLAVNPGWFVSAGPVWSNDTSAYPFPVAGQPIPLPLYLNPPKLTSPQGMHSPDY